MTEDDARAWMADRYDKEVTDRVASFVDMVMAENAVQNLVSPSSIASIWVRHVVDSAQLIDFAPASARSWTDVGTGGGFPGMIVALCWSGAVTMVEPRKLRAAFLQHCVDRLGIDNAAIIAGKIEAVRSPTDVITARAVASVEKLLHAAGGCATPNTRWILPRGRSPVDEVGGRLFHVEQSITDPASSIVTFDGVG
ncbi:16S rRNA (guanine(527)-N(7))-methyltransferase RsmG [Sphingomonas sp. Tas61C01]|uniref:16S rRNA (guanine(527)-N(7))-methyltransferase RsmG n=1 Tax=Sphingomonas sp. Tas61C01 TaxID=3458297 RepID=UPI00403E97EA